MHSRMLLFQNTQAIITQRIIGLFPVAASRPPIIAEPTRGTAIIAIIHKLRFVLTVFWFNQCHSTIPCKVTIDNKQLIRQEMLNAERK